MSDAVLLIGSPGAGKSSVLESLATLLEIDGTPHGRIESEVVGLGFPMLPPEAWIPMVEQVLILQRRAGCELMLIAATPESEDELQQLRALAGAHVIVICLTAPGAVAAARVQEREPDSWPDKQWLVEHARELAETIPRFTGIDVAISTDGRAAADVAAEVRQLAIEHGVLSPVEGKP